MKSIGGIPVATREELEAAGWTVWHTEPIDEEVLEMITDAENKSIPGPRLQRMHNTPSTGNIERLVCESCQHVAPVGGEVIHARDCPYAIKHKAKRVAEAETK